MVATWTAVHPHGPGYGVPPLVCQGGHRARRPTVPRTEAAGAQFFTKRRGATCQRGAATTWLWTGTPQMVDDVPVTDRILQRTQEQSGGFDVEHHKEVPKLSTDPILCLLSTIVSWYRRWCLVLPVLVRGWSISTTMVAERHATTATKDPTGDQPKNWRATTQEPIGTHHDSFHDSSRPSTTNPVSNACCCYVQSDTKQTRCW